MHYIPHDDILMMLNLIPPYIVVRKEEDMVNIELLKDVIDDSGMTMVALANKSGIKRETLYQRLKGVGEFTASEIVGLVDALKLNKTQRESIFFS